MTKADLEGDIVISEVVVFIVILGPGADDVGEDGCVRSNPCSVWWSQKFVGEPTTAFLGFVTDVMVELFWICFEIKDVNIGLFTLIVDNVIAVYFVSPGKG